MDASGLPVIIVKAMSDQQYGDCVRRERYSFRRAQIGDEAFLWEMLYHAIFVPEGQPAPPRTVINEPDLARYVAGWGREADNGVVAVFTETHQPVGAAWFRCFPSDSRGFGFMDSGTPELAIAVLPDHRGFGLGTRMLHQLIEIASARFARLSLSCDPRNRAWKLYSRLGFRQIGHSRTMVLSLTRQAPGAGNETEGAA
jgi:GNAT superfamily N-acetyltransferase